MSKKIPFIILLLFLNSCSPIIKTHGYTIENTSDFSNFISEIASNERVSKEKILNELGSPSIQIDNVDNIWIYLFSTKKERSFSESEIQSQLLIKLTFNSDNLLTSHEILTAENYNQIEFSTETTAKPENKYGLTDQFLEAFTRGR
tara:strand:- start:224 stop:661 length:438 start_codon:yes stop_codon:yes gene_type:complete